VTLKSLEGGSDSEMMSQWHMNEHVELFGWHGYMGQTKSKGHLLSFSLLMIN